MTKLEYLKKYSTNIALLSLASLSSEELKLLPKYWIEALAKQSIKESNDRILKEWHNYTQQFQVTINYMKFNLKQVELVREDGIIALLYTIKNKTGKDVYYIGYNPLLFDKPKFYSQLPQSFQNIYSNLHSGWVYFASKSNGLSIINDIIILGEEDWGILEDINLESYNINLNKSLGLFHNGMGDYVSIDLDSDKSNIGFIWWHNEPPTINIDVWSVIDEWTKIGIED